MKTEANMLSNDVKAAYDDFYSNSDVAWRMLGAKFKAQNILDVCKGYSFSTILEVGAGDGSILHFLNEWQFGTELHALEIAESGVNLIKERNLNRLKSARTFNGYQIPFEDQSVDLIILSHVLEHVEHERILLRELKRVAKHCVIEVPKDYRFNVDQRMSHFLSYGHINMYTPTLLRFLLKSEGFEVLKDKVSMTSPEVNFFNEFVNKKRQKSLLLTSRIRLEYLLKKSLGTIFGKKKLEQFANAYTLLSRTSDRDLQIF